MDKPFNIKITDRNSFIKFLKILQSDFSNCKWENNNLADYLGAMTSYTEDIQGYYDNTGQPINADNASWKVFADILIGATMYE